MPGRVFECNGLVQFAVKCKTPVFITACKHTRLGWSGVWPLGCFSDASPDWSRLVGIPVVGPIIGVEAPYRWELFIQNIRRTREGRCCQLLLLAKEVSTHARTHILPVEGRQQCVGSHTRHLLVFQTPAMGKNDRFKKQSRNLDPYEAITGTFRRFEVWGHVSLDTCKTTCKANTVLCLIQTI